MSDIDMVTINANSSDSSSMLNPRKPDPIMVVNSGEATYHFQSQVITWCAQYNNTMNRWPRDEYTCILIIEPWEAHERIGLTPLLQDHSAQKLFSDIDEVVQNGWELTTEEYIANSSIWTSVYPVYNNDTHRSDRYVVYLYLKRQASAHNILFYTPLIVLFIFVLMSFWTEPLTLTRVWFYTSSTVVICMGLSYIDYLIPCHTVPSILLLYVAVLAGVLLALLLQVGLMTQLAERLCKSMIVQNLLTLQCFRTLFCLPVLKTINIYESINETGSTIEDDYAGVGTESINGNVEEMQSEKVDYSERKEIAEVMDKIMFFIYSVVFATMLALHF